MEAQARRRRRWMNPRNPYPNKTAHTINNKPARLFFDAITPNSYATKGKGQEAKRRQKRQPARCLRFEANKVWAIESARTPKWLRMIFFNFSVCTVALYLYLRVGGCAGGVPFVFYHTGGAPLVLQPDRKKTYIKLIICMYI